MEIKNPKKIILNKRLKDRGKAWSSNFKFDKKIYGSSYDKVDFHEFGGFTLLRGYYRAYEEHCPIYISPDIIWLLILQGFASHINFNAEELRSHLVNFEGQKMLIVNLPQSRIEEVTSETFANCFKNFSGQIEEFIGKKKKEIFDFNFSTTTETIKTVGYATLMCGMQKYFKYEVRLYGCGIPYILLDGTLEDWNKIKENIQNLCQFGLENWVQSLTKIIEKIISEINAETPDKAFWNNFIQKNQFQEYGPSGRKLGNVDAIQGWLLTFYPYNANGKYRFNYALEGPIKKKDLYKELNYDILITPIKVTDVTGKSYDLELRSGFIGMIKGKDSLVMPKIGWFISEKSTKYEQKYENENGGRYREEDDEDMKLSSKCIIW